MLILDNEYLEPIILTYAALIDKYPRYLSFIN